VGEGDEARAPDPAPGGGRVGRGLPGSRRTLTRFDRDTAVEPLGDGRYGGTIHERWFIVRGPNGGYVGAIIQNALRAAVGDPERAARSLTIHYLSAPEAGPIEIETRIEREGRSLTNVSARASQGGTAFAVALGAFSKPRAGRELAELAMPSVPGPDEVDRLTRPNAPPPAFAENFDMRWASGALPFSGGDEARIAAWIRLPEPRALDDALVVQYADAFPPPVFSTLSEPAFVPTVDLTVHFREPLPVEDMGAEDFALGVFWTDVIRDGFFVEDGQLWSPSGRLIAQTRQLGPFIAR
jgi:acyl-CoA thioesterase